MTNYEKIKNMSVEELAIYIITNAHKYPYFPANLGLKAKIITFLESDVTND